MEISNRNILNTIDIVVPILNECNNLSPLIDKICSSLKGYFSEINIMLIDDGSDDGTEIEIEKIFNSQFSARLKYIKLSRNYGKDIALKCGIDNSTSDFCALMDGDLQHPPEKILEAIEQINMGFNIVHIEKAEYLPGSKIRRGGSALFKKLINHISDVEIQISDFKLLDKKAVNATKQFREINYFNRGIVDLIGLKACKIYYTPDERMFGTSKYSLKNLIKLTLDSLIAVSIKPLRASIYLGAIISVFSFFYGLYIMFEKIFLGQPIQGFATLATALFFLGGIQILILGIIGEYLGRTFLETKMRPQYIIDYQLDADR